MPGSGKRRISANQILADMRSGMSDSLLKQKYGLTDKALDSVYSKLRKAGVLHETEILNRSVRAPAQDQSVRENLPVDQWQCPSCHATQDSEKEECPVCGIVVAKFTARPDDGPSLAFGGAPLPHAESKAVPKWVSAVVSLVILAAVGVTAAWLLLPAEPEPHRPAFNTVPLPAGVQTHAHKNALAIKNPAAMEVLEIQLQPLTDLNFKTKSEVLRMRSEAVARHSQLMAGNYQPSDAVFGQIVDGLPWWGILGAYTYGKGDRSIAGPALHSESILNPYLLVVPDFNIRLHPQAVEGMDEQTGYTQFYCAPRHLRWQPRLGRAEVTYDAECLRRNRAHSFSLAAYNARDLNLKYIYVSYRDSRNIVKQDEPTGAYENPQYIHQGPSCGFPGGCNNMSPQTPPIDDIRIVGWPVEVVIRLWENNPGTIEKHPDMEYIMHFN